MKIIFSTVMEISSTSEPCEKAINQETSQSNANEMINTVKNKLLYSVEDIPPWHHILLFSIQHYLTLFGGLLAKTYLITPVLCIKPENPARAHIVSTCAFVSGLATLLQTTVGIRLPIVQIPGTIFLLPVIAHLTSPEWKCPETLDYNNSQSKVPANETEDEVWQIRMREVQGAILIATSLEVIIGISGFINCMKKFITPLVITPVLTLPAFSLFEDTTKLASSSWSIAILTVVIIVLFSYVLNNISATCCLSYCRNGCRFKPLVFFSYYPVLLAIVLTWLLCLFLTHISVFAVGSKARTDYNIEILTASPWFRIPYPGQWGLPSVSFAGGFGMLVAVMVSIVDTFGDYYACVMMSGSPPPPAHALNRGIFFDGIGGILSALWGTGNSSTSSSSNIAIIGITKVASRRVVQVAAILMMILGTFSKVGALFVTIPEPIIGGVVFVLFSISATVGLANLKYVDLDSPRNLFVIGFPLFCGLAIPKWLDKNADSIQTGVQELDSVLLVILRNNIFIGGFLGLMLDYSLPGTDEERGLTKWANDYTTSTTTSQNEINKFYDLPFGMTFLRKHECSKYFSLSPTYSQWSCIKSHQRIKINNKSTITTKKNTRNTDYVLVEPHLQMSQN